MGMRMSRFDLESKLTLQVAKRFDSLIAKGYKLFYYKTHGWIYQRIGLPDFIVCAYGLFAGIELKLSNNELSKAQNKVAELILKAGGEYFLIVDDTFDDDFNLIIKTLYQKGLGITVDG